MLLESIQRKRRADLEDCSRLLCSSLERKLALEIGLDISGFGNEREFSQIGSISKLRGFSSFQRAALKSIYFAHKQSAINDRSVDNYLSLYFWASNYEIKSSLLLKHPLWPPPGWIKSFECRRHSSPERHSRLCSAVKCKSIANFAKVWLKGCQALFSN